MTYVYLLHFDQPYPNGRKPQHYLGVASDLETRMAEHRRGSAKSRLTRAFALAGIAFTIVRTWRFEEAKDAFDHERKLKARKKSYACFCETCSKEDVQ